MRLSFFIIGLSLLSLFVACQRQESGLGVDRQLVALIPADAPILAGVNIERLKSTSLYQRYGQLNVPLIDAASQRIGLDPRRDLSAVLITFDKGQLLTFARGSFSNSVVQSKLQALGSKKSDDAGQVLLSNGSQAVLFPSDGTAAMGSLAALQQLASKQTNTGLSDGLRARLRSLPETEDVWIVMDGKLPPDVLPSHSGFGSLATSFAGFLNGAAAGVNTDSGLHLQAHLSCVSDGGAQQVHDALRGLIGFARLSVKDDQKDLLHVYDAIKVDQEKSMVHVRMDLPPELADKLFSQYLGSFGAYVPR